MPKRRSIAQQVAAVDLPPDEGGGSPSLLRLFLSFLRLGMTAFGGPAMVAYIHKLAVERNRWIDDTCFQEGVALCQTIPGATAMQMAAYVGLRSRGLGGAAVSFVGFGLPAFCSMTLLAAFYARTHDVPFVLAAFKGLRAITVALVANAAFSFGRRSLTGVTDIIIAILAAAMFAIKASPVVVILVAALVGLLLHWSPSKAHSQTVGESPIQARSRWQVALILVMVVAGGALLFLADRKLFDLGILMFRIDLFAFGGGFASVPLMYHEIVDVRSWMDGPTLMNGIALGQVTPGPIVITATFAGYFLCGFAGAVVATVGVFLPSFLMLVGVVPYFDRLRASDRFNRCMAGILASFVGLLLSVTLQFARDVPWDVPRTLLAASALAALLSKVDVLWVILAGTVLSLMLL